ncbi:hypothetical protein [Nonomuraea sp. NPDC049158]|uniref:hypothetical protein n=1 Tax=Nonomuraea sp. NPDC049158 TaxID=3155649 RepID=UPI0034062B31
MSRRRLSCSMPSVAVLAAIRRGIRKRRRIVRVDFNGPVEQPGGGSDLTGAADRPGEVG